MSKRSERRGSMQASSPKDRQNHTKGDQIEHSFRRRPLFLLLFSVLVTVGTILLIWPIMLEIGTAAAIAVIIPLIAFSLIPLLLLRPTRQGSRANDPRQ